MSSSSPRSIGMASSHWAGSLTWCSESEGTFPPELVQGLLVAWEPVRIVGNPTASEDANRLRRRFGADLDVPLHVVALADGFADLGDGGVCHQNSSVTSSYWSDSGSSDW